MKKIRYTKNLVRRNENGSLAVFQKNENIDFDLKRAFIIQANKGDIRGMHAHKLCTQLLVCVAGRVEVECSNGQEVVTHLLGGLDDSLLIPPGTWSTQKYLDDTNSLIVFCDSEYDEQDYIRNFDQYIKFTQEKK